MSLTFGFVTDGKNDEMLEIGIKSILNSNIENYEILVVGNSSLRFPGVKFVEFDENEKIGWITRKKNLLAVNASNETLIIVHDYLTFENNWTQENIQNMIDQEWDVAVCKVLNFDGKRFRDWVIWPFNSRFLRLPFIYNLKCLVPYEVKSLSNLMYINGTVLIVRREYFLLNPLDEKRVWGQGEDVEWSIRLRDSWRIKLFCELSIKSLKNKDAAFSQMGCLSLILVRIYSFMLRRGPNWLRKLFQISYA